MDPVHVTVHREGALRDVVVAVHGMDVSEGGDVDPQSNPSFVQFRCAGEGGARLRVEIKSGVAIVYREEVQLPPEGGKYDSGYRNFRI